MKLERQIKPTLIILILAFAISCTKQVELKHDADQTPPEIGILVNSTPLQDTEEVQAIQMTLVQNIQLQGTAVDEQSGIKYVNVGIVLNYKCLNEGDSQIYSGGNEWSNKNNFPGRYKSKRIITNKNAVHNFRLIYLRDQCRRDEVLLKAEGEIYVSARNYFGKLNQKTYNVIFELTDPYN